MCQIELSRGGGSLRIIREFVGASPLLSPTAKIGICNSFVMIGLRLGRE